ncbi:MAG: hypothetical protein B5M55_04065 [Desulfococcus sp. 4484_242]|nr:MAG: hypothetical protein B5M55_04065 [Desulfococcus sp. 4484_242]
MSKKAGYKQICLWIFEGLDQARSIYERHGFLMTRVRDVPQWGRIVREQMSKSRLNNSGIGVREIGVMYG